MTASTKSPLTFALETSPSEATIRAIKSGLNAHSSSVGLKTDWSPHWIIGRDADGAVQAGMRFVLAFDWLFVNWLWVANPWRKHGIGSQLMGAPKRSRARRAAAPPISTRSRSRRRSFTKSSATANSAGSMIFRRAIHASGFARHFEDSRLRQIARLAVATLKRARLPIGHLGTEDGMLRQSDVIHERGSLNTVVKTMRLKRSSGSALRSTFMRRMAPSQADSRNSARSSGANVSVISPAP